MERAAGKQAAGDSCAVASFTCCRVRPLPLPQVGLDVWLRDGNVFKCWRSMWDVIWHGELGSSLALLNAGEGTGTAVGCVPSLPLAAWWQMPRSDGAHAAAGTCTAGGCCCVAQECPAADPLACC